MRFPLSATILLLCLQAPVFGGPATPQASQPVPVGQALPNAQLHGLNGRDHNLADFRGRPLIINVWASWCGPCRAEMASLERLAWLDTGAGFAIIGISTDDDPEAPRTLLARNHATISHFIDSHLEMETMLGASRLPLTVLVGADGRVLKRIGGAQEWDSPEALRLIRETFGKSRTPPL